MSQPQYLSTDGLAKIHEELHERKTIIRQQLSEQIGSAKELGDLSENFEYHDAKERQGQNETRILELEDTIRNAVIVESKTGGNKINLGTKFKVSIGGIEKIFEIVGATESDPMNGKISNESPLGNGFIGLCVGDTSKIKTPGGEMEYKVISIE
ncbi:transcription elongation factor GreA [Patescibacteria group bacterium]|nr:transcription elongation factor GreA [Patescibacteria group bacterium]MBU4452926.1 transcription elongation factor GreA [Patescibacteria group bacterium]